MSLLHLCQLPEVDEQCVGICTLFGGKKALYVIGLLSGGDRTNEQSEVVSLSRPGDGWIPSQSIRAGWPGFQFVAGLKGW